MTPATDPIFAHSVDDQPETTWEPLDAHLEAVADRAAGFAHSFGCPGLARAAGLLHDLGKASPEFQAYIRGHRSKGGDHSAAGALVARQTYPAGIGRLIATAVAGHHAGLADGPDLDRRLDAAAPLLPGQRPPIDLPPLPSLAPDPPHRLAGPKGFAAAFLTRMVFSALVDADFLETERFYATARGQTVERGPELDIATLADRLNGFLARLRAASAPGPVNRLRGAVLDHVLDQAGNASGLFTLTVPTGGGKTLASLAFGLEHARRQGLRRLIYVIPYTSVVEQTAAVFRDALGTADAVLEHHAAFDWEAAAADRTDEEGRAGQRKLRRAAENWDAPIIVTTAVQFFESLFADRSSRCRKLHNIARSVVILDEAQTLPLPLLRPCLAAIEELGRNYHTSVILCTATPPAVRVADGFPGGLNLAPDRELAPDPPELHRALTRVAVERLADPIDDAALAGHLADRSQILCIVNSRAHAQALFERIADRPGAIHLSTLMCPAHRRSVLADVRRALQEGAPVRVVATSLVEAGVDIDFPEVWRAAAGLDSIAQAAGRCNREGRLQGHLGRVVVFEPTDAAPPHEVAVRWQAAREALRRHDDPLGLDAVRAYFRELFWQKGPDAFDAVEVDGGRGILRSLSERAGDGRFAFAEMAKAFRMIDDAGAPVVVPWRADPADRRVDALLDEIAAARRPLRGQMRRLQPFLVQIPKRVRAQWLADGRLISLLPDGSSDIAVLADASSYNERIGIALDRETERTAEENIIS